MLEVMEVVDTDRRRRFSVADKIRIVEESLAGPNMVRSTARRYGVAVSGLYPWLSHGSFQFTGVMLRAGRAALVRNEKSRVASIAREVGRQGARQDRHWQ